MAAGAEARGWQVRWRQLVDKLVRVESEEGKRELLDQLAAPARPTVLAFVNAHAMNSAASSRPFLDALLSADIVLRDGSGMALLLKLLDLPPGLNLNGTDLIPKIVSRYDGRPIAFFGTQDPYLSNARELVGRAFAPRSECITASGFLPASEYLALAASQAPALIVLGMGMPKQEQVARELRAGLHHPCLIVCGGAIIDFMGGKTPRAPRWVRSVGMEWLYRLGLEPRRLFRRYVLGNPLFVARALRLAAAGAQPAGQRSDPAG